MYRPTETLKTILVHGIVRGPSNDTGTRRELLERANGAHERCSSGGSNIMEDAAVGGDT